MKSFGELLTEYMTRTGISDSEMARHLGVSRQTIFRWKEGMTARPRVREDVLRCADRLRLTASERDTLLLAAGFAPEIRQVNGDAGESSSGEPSALAAVSPASVAIVEPATLVLSQPHPERRARGLLIGLLVFLGVVGLIAAGYFLLPQERDNLIALVIPPTPTLPPTPTPPEQLIAIARFNSRGGTAPPYDMTARLRQVLEREIDTQKLVGARLTEVADAVRDEVRAEQLRLRGNADILLWGNFSGDNARVEIGSNPRLPLVKTDASVLPILPRDQSVTLDMSAPDQIRALALVILLPLHLDREGATGAQQTLQQAQALAPVSKEMRATMDFYRGYLAQTTEPRNLQAAVKGYADNLKTTSLYEAYLNRGLAYLGVNEDAAAKADFTSAQQVGNNRPEAWRATCWAFVLEQQPQAALPFCEASATRDATGWSLDTRGIVYAGLGRYADAANELENFLRWLATQPSPVRETFTPSRRAWIESLRAGKNPFDGETLNKLRGAP